MCHTDIGGCKLGVLHWILIEFILIFLSCETRPFQQTNVTLPRHIWCEESISNDKKGMRD